MKKKKKEKKVTVALGNKGKSSECKEGLSEKKIAIVPLIIYLEFLES